MTATSLTPRHCADRPAGTARHEDAPADRAKSQLLASMSHDIRTPLNGVLGMTELLLNTGLSAQQRRYAQTAYECGEALLNIINDILDYSRIEAGRLELDAQPCSLTALIEAAADLLAPRAHQKRLELTCQIDPALPATVLADSARLSQVLVNLLSNAIKFTGRGEINLQITRVADAEAPLPGSGGAAPAIVAVMVPVMVPVPVRVRFAVSDSGIGITTDLQHALTHAFANGDTTTVRRAGGTGLGLIICQRLLGMMGGALELESAAGRGSTFSFCIPLTPAASHAAGNCRPADGLAESATALPGRRILIVDDNATNRGILIRQLQHWGVECAAASDAYQALDMLRAAQAGPHAFEAALIDMKMPGMSGVEMAETLQADASLAGLPRLMLTSISEPGEIARARAAGTSVWLEKPVRPADLHKALSNALRGERRLRGPRPPPPAPGSISGSVLVVEDNPVNREIAIAMLEATACRVSIAENGRQALAQLADQPVDLVLMDCQMPEMDGFEAVRLIRASGGGGPGALAVPANVPVIALTANALAGDREHCLAAGFDDYLAKPFTEAGLFAVLRHWLPVHAGTGTGGAGDATTPRGCADAVAGVVAAGAEGGAASALTGTPDAAILDPAVIARLHAIEHNGTPGLVARLARTFLDSTPPLFDQLREAAEAGDLDGTRHAAHTLKTCHANLGAMRMSLLCARIESHAQAANAAKALACVSEADTALPAVLEAIAALAARPSAGSAQILRFPFAAAARPTAVPSSSPAVSPAPQEAS